MNRRGMTLLELLVGLVTAAIIAAVIAKTLLLGIKTYNYAVRQTSSLTRTRKALAGDGSRTGVLGESRAAYAFSSALPSSFTALSSSMATTSFYVTKNILYRSKSGQTGIQADAVGGLSLNYYMSTAGIISSTTVAASATMVTALIAVTTGTASSGTQNAYSLYSGAALRNHP